MVGRDFTLFPQGTEIYGPDKEHCVVVAFATEEDAIVFYQFLASFVKGEFSLEAKDKDND